MAGLIANIAAYCSKQGVSVFEHCFPQTHTLTLSCHPRIVHVQVSNGSHGTEAVRKKTLGTAIARAGHNLIELLAGKSTAADGIIGFLAELHLAGITTNAISMQKEVH